MRRTLISIRLTCTLAIVMALGVAREAQARSCDAGWRKIADTLAAFAGDGDAGLSPVDRAVFRLARATASLAEGGDMIPPTTGDLDMASTNTIRLHRVLKAPAERVYRAFLEPDALAKWLPPQGFTAKVHESDARVGGGHRMSFTNFGTGRSHAFSCKYVELTPHERIRYTDRFDDPGLPGEMQVTVTFRAVTPGTELHVIQEGVPAVIPVEACYLGWQESLEQLASLVEPEIPDGE